MNYWNYLAFPTVTRTWDKGTSKGAPYNIYKVSHVQYICPHVIDDIPTITAYKVNGTNEEGELDLEDLTSNGLTREFLRVAKWVIDRKILDCLDAGCRVSEKEVKDMLAEKELTRR
ncbi:hypothetical protein GF361_02585 [Candidatus Woesearchaeota archaeon]|nr:hypothetical protein [Candidatus Woesearchaeota archaeon]